MSISQNYLNFTIKARLYAFTYTEPQAAFDLFQTPTEATKTNFVELGNISIIKIERIVYMLLPLVNFMITNAPEVDYFLEIKYLKNDGTYASISELGNDIVPSYQRVIAGGNNALYIENDPPGNFTTALPILGNPPNILSLPYVANSLDNSSYFKYCPQRLNNVSYKLGASSGGAPSSNNGYGFKDLNEFESNIGALTYRNAEVGQIIGNFDTYISFIFSKNPDDDPTGPFRTTLNFVDAELRTYISNERRLPFTILPSIYTYYV